MMSFNLWKKFTVITFICIEIILSEPIWYKATETSSKRFLIDTEENYNWYQAFHECSRYDAQLVVIDTKIKNDILKKVLQKINANNNNLWIAGTDAFGENVDNRRSFYWSPTEEEFTYTNWAKSQPDNFMNKEHCVYVVGDSPTVSWNDIYCDTKGFGFICEDIKEFRKTANAEIVTKSKDNGSIWGLFA